MSTQNRNNIWHHTLGVSLAIAASTGLACAGTYTWNARSGLFPGQVDPAMYLWTSPGVKATLTNDSLLLRTEPASFQLGALCTQTTNLAMPPQLVIEAEVKFGESASTPDSAGRTGVAIGFQTGRNSGRILFIDRGRIFLSSTSAATPGPASVVLTDDNFHRYRIEVDSPTNSGAAFRIYYDGGLKFTDNLLTSGENVQDYAELWWGDGSSTASGTSYWRYFHHNAAARTTGPRLSTRVAGVVSWWADTNNTYQVQWVPHLGSTTWTDLGLPAAGDDSIKSISDPNRDESHRFYRVLLKH